MISIRLEVPSDKSEQIAGWKISVMKNQEKISRFASHVSLLMENGQFEDVHFLLENGGFSSLPC